MEPERNNIPADETARRQKIAALRIYAELYVNDQFVARTVTSPVSFPNFEVDIGEQLKVYVLTMPSSIRLNICMEGFINSVIAEVRTEAPGEFVKTLTSTSTLIKKLDFENPPYSGSVFAQAEWVGTGPNMPPKILTAADSVLSKQRKIQEEGEIKRIQELKDAFRAKESLFDIDAPENDWKVILLKEYYNKRMQALLKKDMMLPLHEFEPARFKILKYRNVIPELKEKVIPMLESEIMQQPLFANVLKVTFIFCTNYDRC